MEINLKEGSIRAHSKEVIGCKKHDADIMISFDKFFGDEITDLFLTEKQAINFWEELGEKLEQNKAIPRLEKN